jgi:hypothetical protein
MLFGLLQRHKDKISFEYKTNKVIHIFMVLSENN